MRLDFSMLRPLAIEARDNGERPKIMGTELLLLLDEVERLTAYLSRQHELLREAEEAMEQIDYGIEVDWALGVDENCERLREVARSWIARYREQEEGL